MNQNFENVSIRGDKCQVSVGLKYLLFASYLLFHYCLFLLLSLVALITYFRL